jgi:hypothetical protein
VILSGLTEAQLRDWLQEVRRIAALDEDAALREVDTLAFSLAAAVENADVEIGDELLGRGLEAGKERLQQELAAARLNLQHSSRIRAFDAIHLRQSAYYTEDDAERREVAGRAGDRLCRRTARACPYRADRQHGQPPEALSGDRPCGRGTGEAGAAHSGARAARPGGQGAARSV